MDERTVAPPTAADDVAGGMPSRRRRWSLVVLGVLVSTGIAAGCGDDDDEDDVGEANAAVCADVGGLGDAVTALRALDPAVATRDDYSNAADAVQDARSALDGSIGDLVQSEWERVRSDVDALVEQVREAPDDQAVADVAAAAQPQVDALQASLATLGTAVCEVGGGSATTGG